jgi:hypothetical protein
MYIWWLSKLKEQLGGTKSAFSSSVAAVVDALHRLT